MTVDFFRCSLLVPALALTVFLGSCTKEDNLTEQEVVDVIHRFDAGWKDKNTREVDSVLAPAYVYFTQSGGVYSREGVVKTAGSPEYTLDNVERNSLIVTLYQNTAVVSTRWVGKGVYRRVPFDEDQRCSVVVVKTNGKVQILTEHCTPIKASTLFH